MAFNLQLSILYNKKKCSFIQKKYEEVAAPDCSDDNNYISDVETSEEHWYSFRAVSYTTDAQLQRSY